MKKTGKKKVVKTAVRLRKSTLEWMQKVEKEFILSDHHKMLLLLAARSWDRCDAAAKEIARGGTTFSDRLGNLKPVPAIKIELDAANLFERTLRALGLDIESSDVPRPGKTRRSF